MECDLQVLAECAISDQIFCNFQRFRRHWPRWRFRPFSRSLPPEIQQNFLVLREQAIDVKSAKDADKDNESLI